MSKIYYWNILWNNDSAFIAAYLCTHVFDILNLFYLSSRLCFDFELMQPKCANDYVGQFNQNSHNMCQFETPIKIYTTIIPNPNKQISRSPKHSPNQEGTNTARPSSESPPTEPPSPKTSTTPNKTYAMPTPSTLGPDTPSVLKMIVEK